MNQRTRRFLVGATLVMAVGLCTGLVAYYSGNLGFAAPAAGPAELAYLPGDTMAVAYADVRGVMDSEFRQQLRQVLPSGEEKEKLHAEIGLDLEKDVDTVVAGMATGPFSPAGAIAIVRGRFVNSWIEQKAVEHGARVEEYRGKKLIVMGGARAVSEPAAGGGDTEVEVHAETHSTGGVAFLDGGLIALGETSALKRAIDAAADGTNVTKNAELMQFVADIQSNTSAWVVGRVDRLSESTSLPDDVRMRIPPVQWFVATARINGGIEGTVKAEAKDDQSGEQLRDVVRGALAGAQLLAGQDQRLQAMMRNVQVAGTGKSVSVSFTVPPEILDIINGIAGLNHLKSGTTPR
jgi:hypothetical protein